MLMTLFSNSTAVKMIGLDDKSYQIIQAATARHRLEILITGYLANFDLELLASPPAGMSGQRSGTLAGRISGLDWSAIWMWWWIAVLAQDWKKLREIDAYPAEGRLSHSSDPENWKAEWMGGLGDFAKAMMQVSYSQKSMRTNTYTIALV